MNQPPGGTATEDRPPAPGRPSMFREQALRKAATPGERLDELMAVTSKRSWLALAALLAVTAATIAYGLFGRAPTTVDGLGITVPVGGSQGGLGVIESLWLGQVTETLLETQEHFEAGDPIALVRTAEGEEVAVTSDREGVIVERLVSPGKVVTPGMRMFVTEPTVDGEAVLTNARVFVPAGPGKRVEPGMRIYLSPDSAPSENFGSIVGEVTKVSEFPVSPARIRLLVQDEPLVELFLSHGPVLEVQVQPEQDSSTPSGFRWTSGDGPPFEIGNGAIVRASVVVSDSRPIDKLFGG